MIVYAESSALLAWLFDEDVARRVATYLRPESTVVCSDLTVLEAERSIVRWTALGALDEPVAVKLRATLHDTTAHWTVLRVTPGIFARAAQPFPREPIRSLDAIHVATLLEARSVVPEVSLLSLDQRVRDNAAALGFEVLP